MRNLVSEYASQFRQDRQKQIKLGAVLAALAVIVAGVVFWQLHNTGVAMTNEVFCGQEEHIHDDACYEELLACDSEDEDHVHDDSCYETVLTCQIPEHTHTVECLIDETADVEAAGDWEATLPEELSGTWANDVVAIAESQVGYTESELNFQLAEDGETHQGYTRYGAWYGNEYGDWDAMFVSFCMNYAGVPEEVIPENSGAWALSVALVEEGLYVEDAEFIPEAGDLVFFDQDEDGRPDTVGIIAGLDSEEGMLTVIEGNSSDAVEENTYETGDETIIAFAVLPDQFDEEADDFEIIGEAVTLTAEGEDYIVTVTYGENAELPDDVELVVSEYENDSETFEGRYAETVDLYKLDEESLEGARLFNISLMADDEEVEPAADVQVEISLIGQDAGSRCSVVHFSDETQVMETTTSFEDDMQTVTFTVDSFSDFMVLSDYEIMPLAAEQGKMNIFKYDSVNGEAYREGYALWVPNGSYYVCNDVNVTSGTTTGPNGLFYYVGTTDFVKNEDEENTYEADYTRTEMTRADISEAAYIVVENGTTEDPNGSGELGSYIYFYWDDYVFHDRYNICLIDENYAPDRLNGDKDLRNNSQYSPGLYEFEEYSYSAGPVSGAVFTLEGTASGDSNAYVGYAYFTVNADGSYTLAGWCTSYDETTGAPNGVTGDYTCFITSGEDGFISIDGLPSSWINFTLHEISAPAGYEQLADDVTFTYEYDGILDENSGGTTSGGTISIANDPIPTVDVDIYKYITGSNGYEVYSLPAGDYYIGYIRASDEEWIYFGNQNKESGNIDEDEENSIYVVHSFDAANNVHQMSNAYIVYVGDDGGYIYMSNDVYESEVLGGIDGFFLISTSLSGGQNNNNIPKESAIYLEDPFEVDGAPLSGAEFIVSRTVEDTNEETGEPITKTEYAQFDENGTLTGWTAEKSEASSVKSGADGFIHLSGFEAGEYTLTETIAPSGYTGSSSIIFSVDEDGNVTYGVDGSGTIQVGNTPGVTENPVSVYKYASSTSDGTYTVKGSANVSVTVSSESDELQNYHLYRIDENNNVTYATTGATRSGVCSDAGGWTASIDYDLDDAADFTANETDGTITFTNLQGGYTYYLVWDEPYLQHGSQNLGLSQDSTDGRQSLDGAGFVLSKTVLDETEQEEKTYYAVLALDSTGYWVVNGWVEGIAEATTITSNSEGYINFDGLESGSYALIETKAPDGYMLLESPIEFSVTADGSVTLTSDNGQVLDDGKTFAVENTAGRELPNTGGIGTWIYTVAGLALISGAGALLVSRKRRAVR